MTTDREKKLSTVDITMVAEARAGNRCHEVVVKEPHPKNYTGTRP